eukprot:3648896-Rhodomonas_salina.1
MKGHERVTEVGSKAWSRDGFGMLAVAMDLATLPAQPPEDSSEGERGGGRERGRESDQSSTGRRERDTRRR